ncbi:MAG: FliM/FliN family flagellar motor switch protein [Armatimonadetes bacterium]|nr:FliM/FliN family flagellar motor switch protein [Armatimonadota bacterium]MDW8027464.1 FliM/FliN family flagellar motor switch protein [Armatimonadota bacterium]
MQALTPEEIQALLQQSEPKDKKEKFRRSKLLMGVSVQPYDMQTTLTLTPRQRAMMRQWADQFAQSLRYALIPLLRMTLELRLNNEGLTSLSDLAERWKEQTFVIPMTTSGNLRGDHFIALSTNLAMVAIDRLLGGPGIVSQSILQRPLSRLEVNLFLKLAERMAKFLLTAITGEEEGQFVQLHNLLTSEEQIAVLTDKVPIYSLCYDFQLGQERGNLWIGLRADALKGLERKFQHRSQPKNNFNTSHPTMSLPVTMRIVLATGRITMKELKQLQVGDVIVLDGFKGEPAMLVWNGRTLCLVRPGILNGHFAAQVLPTKSRHRGEEK